MSEKLHKKKKPWGGRFSLPTDKFVEEFSESISFDYRLFRQDILCSIAHAKMLAAIKVLDASELSAIVTGLENILSDIEAGKIQWSTSLEDIHMNIEAELVKRIGDSGKKLHTARSRNDQVATDMRLYLREESYQIQSLLDALITVLLDLAETHKEVILAGFTHLQVAQPVSFGHHLLAWCEMLLRDRERLLDSIKRTNVLPLGAAALAGSSFPLQREKTAELLGFDQIARNSLDAVSDRDFLIEFAAFGSIVMMHLSRFSEELVLWMSTPFSFIELGDDWCTGSSIMPQKKNPDIPELVRGKSARVYGNLMGLLTLMKSQPLAYNRDNQEDKQFLFDTIDTVKNCLHAFIGMMPTLQVNAERMLAVANSGYSTATDLAELLVRADVPFRDAHTIVGNIVAYAISKGCTLNELSVEEMQRFCPAIDKDMQQKLHVHNSIKVRNHIGGTAPERVAAECQRIRQMLGEKS